MANHGTDTILNDTFYADSYWDDIRVPLSSIKRLGFTDPDWVKLAI